MYLHFHPSGSSVPHHIYQLFQGSSNTAVPLNKIMRKSHHINKIKYMS